MIKQRISRRTFIRDSVGAASATLAVTPSLLNSAALSARDVPFSSAGIDSGKPSAACPATPLEKASKSYKPRYAGPRWRLIYGSYEDAEKFALNELQRMVQLYVPYTLEVHDAEEPIDHDEDLILIGTVANNPPIAELGEKGTFKVPAKHQGYTNACFKSP